MPTMQKAPRRKRDPQSTRIAILEAAKTVLAKDGSEGLSVSSVAQLAGVNRGTAYQHFNAKEELVRATLEWVSQQLLVAVFEDGGLGGEGASSRPDIDLAHLPGVINGMAEFNLRLSLYAVENPEIGRIWLYDVLSRQNPREDVFYKRFEQSMQNFADSDASEKDIDVQALAVLMLTGYFLWPVWVESHAKSKKARQKMAERYAAEVLRVSMHGVIHADGYAILQSFLEKNLNKS
ncbi:TetR/AcrR family transcriptional regulator [Parahaliea maris]|uniref:TetR/AcrR family transcriptional regulator n=1 Tax=Parahaliea maris TaxID=2716870 RepID=A0A5C9A801_9GAMM|nr:TetR/AcrR family transcriptional regulator [Parahaliea maris]TXS95800.1 TetR/AcrR family transcriptional regulator [Parahaliea maris]